MTDTNFPNQKKLKLHISLRISHHPLVTENNRISETLTCFHSVDFSETFKHHSLLRVQEYIIVHIILERTNLQFIFNLFLGSHFTYVCKCSFIGKLREREPGRERFSTHWFIPQISNANYRVRPGGSLESRTCRSLTEGGSDLEPGQTSS